VHGLLGDIDEADAAVIAIDTEGEIVLSVANACGVLHFDSVPTKRRAATAAPATQRARSNAPIEPAQQAGGSLDRRQRGHRANFAARPDSNLREDCEPRVPSAASGSILATISI
jgi:hypothetical protein